MPGRPDSDFPANVIVPERLREVLDSVAPELYGWVVSRVAELDRSARPVADVLIRWSERSILASRIDVDPAELKVDRTFGVRISVIRHAESRDVEERTGTTSNAEEGDLEELWDRPPKRHFARGTSRWPRRGSTRTISCKDCRGKGQWTCAECSGRGKVTQRCEACSGSGRVRADRVALGSATNSKRGVGVVLGSEQCVRCSATGKEVRDCDPCERTGAVCCKRCKGEGRLLTHEWIVSTVRPRQHSILLYVDGAFPPVWIEGYHDPQARIIESDDGQIGARLSLPVPEGARILAERCSVHVFPVAQLTLPGGRSVHLTGAEQRVRGAFHLLSGWKVAVVGWLAVLLLGMVWWSLAGR